MEHAVPPAELPPTARAERSCAVCGALLESWRPRSQKYCSDPCRREAAKQQRASRPADAPRKPRPKPAFTPGTPPVPDPARTRSVPGDSYWAPILAAAERAVGGEPCRICAELIPAKAPWTYRDRHVCSGRCSDTLKRRTSAMIRRGEIDPDTIFGKGTRGPSPEQRAVFSTPRQPQTFRTRPADADFPYEFYGLAPLPGDVVERHGSVTTYATASSLGAIHFIDMVRANTDDADPDPVIALHEESGSFLVYTPGVLWWAETPAEEGRLTSHQKFRGADGRSWTWNHEVIRDVDVEGQPYSWEAWVCVTEATPILWTPAYAARSAKQRRTTRARNSYEARMRGHGFLGVEAESVDPHDIYDRDAWTCQLCRQEIDPDAAWPDPRSATLDHIKPVTLGGEHTPDNLQSAHWICNVRKGDAWGPGGEGDGSPE